MTEICENEGNGKRVSSGRFLKTKMGSTNPLEHPMLYMGNERGMLQKYVEAVK